MEKISKMFLITVACAAPFCIMYALPELSGFWKAALTLWGLAVVFLCLVIYHKTVHCPIKDYDPKDPADLFTWMIIVAVISAITAGVLWLFVGAILAFWGIFPDSATVLLISLGLLFIVGILPKAKKKTEKTDAKPVRKVDEAKKSERKPFLEGLVRRIKAAYAHHRARTAERKVERLERELMDEIDPELD